MFVQQRIYLSLGASYIPLFVLRLGQVQFSATLYCATIIAAQTCGLCYHITNESIYQLIFYGTF